MSREAAMNALLALVTNAYDWNNTPSRRLKLWADVPTSLRPAAFQFEGGHQTYTWGAQNVNPKRAVEVKLFVYIDGHNQALPGATQLNNILDAIDAALAPSGSDLVLGRQTLGGTAWQARIEGNPLMDPGDLDGDGVMVIPIRLVFP